MINLLNAYIGPPSSQPALLALKDRSLLLYPTADSVVILDAHTLALVRILAFSDVFPSTRHGDQQISALTVDPAMKLVLASMGNCLAAWSLSGVQQDTWRVHSSLTLSKDVHITSVDCRSGLLALACTGSLSVYSLALENDLLMWSKKWSSRAPNPSNVRFSPSLQYMVTVTQPDSLVRIYLTTSGRPVQVIPHPRPVVNLSWRQPEPNSRDDTILYTVTRDATLRVFMPVLDAPQHLQLHATLDMHSASPHAPAESKAKGLTSSVFWLDRLVVADALRGVLRGANAEDGKTRRAQDILEEGWDLFLRIFSDGSLVVKALANVNQRPPTLLKQFTLLHTHMHTHLLPTFLSLLPDPKSRGALTLVTSPPISSFALAPLEFFDARAEGLVLRAQSVSDVTFSGSHIRRFARTPEGSGVAVVREQGGEAWHVHEKGARLEKVAAYDAADHVVVLDQGRTLATYSSAAKRLTLHSSPPCSMDVPELVSLFVLPASSPGGHTCIYAITPAPTSILHIHATLSPAPTLTLQSQTQLPLEDPSALVVPVDPMGWSRGGVEKGIVRDVLLSVGGDGKLGFWVPDEGSSTGDDTAARRRTGWKRTGSVGTGRRNISMAACSSAKKTVLVVSRPEGEEITIWDSKESQFASGLEYFTTLDPAERVNDLDWSATPDTQSILAVGYARRIDILAQQRATYFGDAPGWATVRQISLEGVLPHAISDSIWLANGSLLVGAGHQMLLFGQGQPHDAGPKTGDGDESLFEHVARLNGPLVDYHPQMLLQCLLWEKLELVKQIVVNLAQDVKRLREWERLPELQEGPFEWTAVGVDAVLKKSASGGGHKGRPNGLKSRRLNSSLFYPTEANEQSDDDGFSRTLVEELIEHLEEYPLPHLTPNEHAHLLVLVQATLEVDESRRALDANGLRYLISMRSFYILNARAASPTSPEPVGGGAIARHSGWRERLRYRDIVWAFHSESEGLLLASASSACANKMTWSDARALGVFMWARSPDAMRAQMEVVARNEYMAGDARDPVACSLFYFALGKHKLVHGLWRQAAWHREQQAMLKFLGNDFGDARWRTAANKNAYALLSKRRFEYAAAFFLLAGSLKDAVHVCLRNLDDFQLAVALARIHEGGDDGPVLNMILNTKVIPEAFRTGNRYLGSWAFWLLHRRDLAVRILVTPLQDIASTLDPPLVEIGSPHYDDPALALLFSHLKAKTLQAAQGTSEISGRVEFNFVLQIARVFVRMGCHALALDLVQSWSFDRPSTVSRDPIQPSAPPSPTAARFALEPALRRRASIMIDMDIETAPPTRRASPTRELSPVREAAPAKEEAKPQAPDGDLVQRKAGIGSLMKTAKQNVQVAEFDMGAFGF